MVQKYTLTAKKELQTKQKRSEELTRLIKTSYEDKVKGKIPEKNSETEKVQLRKNEKAAGGILPMPTTAFPLFIYATTV
mgnify:CR=1 FL=1